MNYLNYLLVLNLIISASLIAGCDQKQEQHTMQVINTSKAPAAIGTYSQAIKVGNLVFLSGQIGLDPKLMNLVSNDFDAQADQVFKNIVSVVNASHASLSDVVKLTVYLTDLNNFSQLNTIMKRYFKPPFPARSAIEVSALPKGALIEIDAIIAQGQAAYGHEDD